MAIRRPHTFWISTCTRLIVKLSALYRVLNTIWKGYNQCTCSSRGMIARTMAESSLLPGEKAYCRSKREMRIDDSSPARCLNQVLPLAR